MSYTYQSVEKQRHRFLKLREFFWCTLRPIFLHLLGKLLANDFQKKNKKKKKKKIAVCVKLIINNSKTHTHTHEDEYRTQKFVMGNKWNKRSSASRHREGGRGGEEGCGLEGA